MENVINRIIEIDRQAEKKLNEAEKIKADMLEKAKEDVVKLQQQLKGNASSRIEKVEQFHKNDCETAVAELKERCKKDIEAMDKAFAETHTEIENALFKEIAGE